MLAVLRQRGYDVGPAEPVQRTPLDTFDGRLHAAGLRAEVERGAEMSLVVSGAKAVAVRAAIDAMPRFAVDLPPGPLRERLARLIDVRALLPMVTVQAQRHDVVRRHASGRVEVEAGLYDGVAAGRAVGSLPWAVEVRELNGYAQAAAALITLLVELGMTMQDDDVLEAAFGAAGISRTGFSASPTIPLDPQMPALDGYVAVLEHLSGAIEANWSGTVEDVDPEFLHDLRVGVRRTRSVLSRSKNVLPAQVRDRFGPTFKWLGDATGPARDLDVYVLEWDGYIGPLGERAGALEPVRAEIEDRRRAAHATLAKALKSKRAARILPEWRAALADPHRTSAGPDAQRPLGDVVGERIAAAQRRVLKRGRSIAPDTAGEVLHELRKDAKKLRYLLECFGGVLPTVPRKAFVQRLKALQDNLGVHQDADVHVAQLHELAADLRGPRASTDTLVAIGQLLAHLEERRTSSREEFAERFAAYDSKRTHRALRAVLDEADE